MVTKLCELNSNDYKILSCVVDRENNRGLTIGRGSTLKQIVDKTGLSLVKVRTTISILLQQDLIIEGVKRIKAKTYCISQKGSNKLMELRTNIF